MLVYLKRTMVMAMLCSIAMVVYAEDAPVYELDNYPPSFDSQSIPGNTITETQGYEENSISTSSPEERRTPAYKPPASQPLSVGQRLARMEQQLSNLQQSGTLNKTDELQKEVQVLRGQVEELTHQLQQSQSIQKNMYADLDNRFNHLSVTKEPAPPVSVPPKKVKEKEVLLSSNTSSSPPEVIPKNTVKKPATTENITQAVSEKPLPSSSAQPNVAEEDKIYQTAYDLIKSKKYNEAISTLQNMLQKYPSGQFAANAHYWLGELYGLLNKNDQSASEFSIIVKKYSGSPKVADAQLKLGLIYAGEFKWVEAKAAFKKVVQQYPGTASARLATEQLKQIRQSGH